jgi:type VI secretion system protein VasG
MVTKDIKRLLQKLNEHTTRTLEAAVGFCVTRTHYEVTLEHWLIKLLEDGSGDIPRILSHFDISSAKVWDALLKTLEEFRAGNTGKPSFSPTLLQLIESAWVAVSLNHEQPKIRSGALLEALLEMEIPSIPLFSKGGTKGGFWDYMDVLSDISSDELRRDFINIVAGSVEDLPVQTSPEGYDASTHRREGETALDLYTIDITGRARAGEIDPAHGRDKEMRQIIDILSRRRKNNPILVGEAGVGKTHIVEGLALRIVQGDVPNILKEVEIRGLDMGLLEAGAGVKGEFENRLKSVIAEVKQSPKPIVLFIDEAHMLTGAGGPAGSSDAANLLKPELARGELRTIASTTWSEYKRYIERDPALERRFQMVKIDEPSEENASVMLRGTKSKFESYHGIQISNEAVSTAVRLASRYIYGRQLPDKAVDLIDTAAARVKMESSSKPAQLDDVERHIENLSIEIAAVRRDIDTGLREDTTYLEELIEERKNAEEKRCSLDERWKKELELVEQIHSLRQQLAAEIEKSREKTGTSVLVEQAGNTDTQSHLENQDETEDSPDFVGAVPPCQPMNCENDIITQLRAELDRLQEELRKIQGEEPLVHADVDGNIAAQVVSDWTGIPVGNMLKDEVDVLLNFEKLLEERILGQSHAIKEIGDVIRASKTGMRNPESPIGVFLFVGPSGVGKTECARGVADLLFGGERFVITINMSEYQESHTVSQLKGAPPGYVGYGEGGVLTEAVRQRPYSVVILDEVEKAHRDVLNLFYQVFDRGFMRDGEGREIDFKNTVIMMTGNLGADTILELCENEEHPTPDELVKAIWPILLRHFGAALLARFKVIPFYPLDVETMKGIVKLKLSSIGERLKESHKMEFFYAPEVVTRIAERCTQVDTGARNVDFIIDRTILPDISSALLGQLVDGTMPSRLTLELDETGEFTYRFD